MDITCYCEACGELLEIIIEQQVGDTVIDVVPCPNCLIEAELGAEEDPFGVEGDED